MHTHPSLSSRPRVKPGVPLGGVAAILVLAGTVGWAVVAGDPLGSRGDLSRLGQEIALSIGSDGITASVNEKARDRVAERMAARAQRMQGGDGRAVDMAAINRAVADGIEDAAKLATARSEGMKNRRDGDIKYLDRNTAADGTNRLAATAEAPAGLRLAGVMGTVRIKVVDDAQEVLFSMENSRKRYNLSIDDGILWITGPGPQSQPAVTLDISVPRGTPLLVNNFTGDLTVDGNLGAPARLELAEGEMKLGGLESARVRITRSGTVSIGDVKGLAGVQLAGDGEVRMGNVGTAAVELNGNGAVSLGTVAAGLSVSMAGPGDIRVGMLAGDLAAAIPGPGTLTIGGGQADSLAVGVTGPGTVDFNGKAKDPRVLMTGPGRVSLAGHDGTPKVYHVGPGKVDLSR
ncbi:GIN domain-containing protein [Niveispirillum sp. KHB5.9]|uniref:GIN domain-containing protein n=1 Tax=Niveispirillum sp. KHB5.9 TaxID=3400269 RepID=UPI003A8C4994